MKVFDKQWTIASEVATWMCNQLGEWEDPEPEPKPADGESCSDDDEENDTPTLAEMRKKYKNNQTLAAALLRDRELQIEARMLLEAWSPTYAAYQRDLEHTSGQLESAKRQAEMSAGKWIEEELADLARRVGSAAVMSRLDIACAPGAVAVLDADTNDLIVLERRRGNKFWDLVVALMAERAWSESWYMSTMPDIFAVVLHDDEESARQALAWIKETWELVEAAETSEHHAMQKLLGDLGWHKHQLVRELIQV